MWSEGAFSCFLVLRLTTLDSDVMVKGGWFLMEMTSSVLPTFHAFFLPSCVVLDAMTTITTPTPTPTLDLSPSKCVLMLERMG